MKTAPRAPRRAFLARAALAWAVLPVAGLLAACNGGDDDATARRLSAWTVAHNVRETPAGLADSTVRMIVRPTVSGRELRVKLENTVGTAPVTFSAAHVGVTGSGAAVVPGTNRALSFGGRPELTLAPGAGAWSDPLPYDVAAFQRLTLSLDVAAASDASTHTLGLTTNYIAPGRHGADAGAAGYAPVPPIAQGTTPLAFPFYWVAAVDVTSTAGAGTVVAFGDSITDGRCSTTTSGGSGVVVPDLYQRWTDVLAERLAARSDDYPKAIANEGIAGNRVVAGGNGPPALERLDRDVLERAGATHVVFFEGTNDISGGATSATVIAGMQQVIDRVRARGLKIVGATVIPRGRPAGAAGAGFDATQERYRLEVNDWIRAPGRFDGVIDFDAVMAGGGKSPTGAEIIRPDYNCDYIHPNAAGYKAMGEAIDLGLFAPRS